MAEIMDGFDSKLTEEIENHDNNETYSSSSEAEIDEYIMLHSARKNHLFGRQKPLHSVLGGGKSAEIILWRNKQISASIFTGVTVIWFLFECIGYNLLTLICHSLILALTTVFICSNLASSINVSPPKLPKVTLPDDAVLASFVLLLKGGISHAFIAFQDVASGKDLKKFLSVIVALWVVSVIGSWFSFFTLFYLLFVLLQTVPLYEKHEDIVDTFAEKAWIEVKKQYAIFDENVLQRLPMFTSQKDHKHH